MDEKWLQSALEDMNADPVMQELYVWSDFPIFQRDVLNTHKNEPEGRVPDWIPAGLNCKDDSKILSVCQFAYLNAWTPK